LRNDNPPRIHRPTQETAVQLRFEPSDEDFRREVRAFLEARLPAEVRRRSRIGMHPPCDPDRRWWNRALHEQGWVAPHWPREFGGTGWSALQAHIFEQECWAAGAPELRWQGLKLLGPVVYTFGSAAQKARYLPPILRGDCYWAQGFSEPGAGSDLASLKTSAVRNGDHYVVNGQKLWTSEAQHSDGIFILARTNPAAKPQRGLSMLLLPLDTPGVRVRPVPLIDGGVAVNEVFFEDVHVPAEQLIGTPDSGWEQAKFLLANERTGSAEIYRSRAQLRRVRASAQREAAGGSALLDDPVFAARLSAVELDLDALEWSVLRVLCEAPSVHPPAALASVLKIRGSEIQQRIAELGVEALACRGLRRYRHEEAFAAPSDDPLWPDDIPGMAADLLYLRACTVFGGSKEIQKNLVAKALGL
jgi:alkylation response protein AidB-like acyl-CoA dehydrogenase